MKVSQWLETPDPHIVPFQRAQRRRQTAYTYKQSPAKARAPVEASKASAPDVAKPQAPSETATPANVARPIVWYRPPAGTLRAALWLAFLAWLVGSHIR